MGRARKKETRERGRQGNKTHLMNVSTGQKEEVKGARWSSAASEGHCRGVYVSQHLLYSQVWRALNGSLYIRTLPSSDGQELLLLKCLCKAIDLH